MSLLPQPAKDHCWLASAPTTHGPSMKRPTADGPILHLPVPSRLLLAVGNVMVGPAPQINLLGLDGDRKKVGLMSPIPAALSTWGNSEGWLMMGVMMRAIRFQLSVRWRGITGWTLRT